MRTAETRLPLDAAGFTACLIEEGINAQLAEFVWEEFQPYYFAPLTPYPHDRIISEMKIDSDDLSDVAVRFEKQFGRKWLGKWVGPDDPTLAEFAIGLMASTTAK